MGETGNTGEKPRGVTAYLKHAREAGAQKAEAPVPEAQPQATVATERAANLPPVVEATQPGSEYYQQAELARQRIAEIARANAEKKLKH